jgi:cytochrome b561
MVELDYYDAWYKGSVDLHKSIGICLLVLWCLRLFWRAINTKQQPQFVTGKFEKIEQLAAHWMHCLLYLVMIVLMCSGYLISTADGRGIMVIEIFEIPAFNVSIANQEDIAGDVHFILAWLLISLDCSHDLAAIKHHRINKDDTLKKMTVCKKLHTKYKIR